MCTHVVLFVMFTVPQPGNPETPGMPLPRDSLAATHLTGVTVEAPGNSQTLPSTDYPMPQLTLGPRPAYDKQVPHRGNYMKPQRLSLAPETGVTGNPMKPSLDSGQFQQQPTVDMVNEVPQTRAMGTYHRQFMDGPHGNQSLVSVETPYRSQSHPPAMGGHLGEMSRPVMSEPRPAMQTYHGRPVFDGHQMPAHTVLGEPPTPYYAPHYGAEEPQHSYRTFRNTRGRRRVYSSPDYSSDDSGESEYDYNRHSRRGRSTSHRYRERVPILRPGTFDGSGSWRDFLRRFESCAKANHWSEQTMGEQLRHCLTGQAGSIVHKNSHALRWSYSRIVWEVDCAYGPVSDHAATLSMELRERVRGVDEPLHSLRDDISEKVSIVYGDCTEAEQDRIGVEIFRNALKDSDLVQKLLEK